MSSGALAYGCCSRFGGGPGGLAPHEQVLAVWATSRVAEARARRKRWARQAKACPTPAGRVPAMVGHALACQRPDLSSALSTYCANVISSSLDPDPVAQALGGGHPDIVALKVHGQDIVMRGRRVRDDLCHLTRRVPNQHLRLVGIQRGAVDGGLRREQRGEGQSGRNSCNVTH